MPSILRPSRALSPARMTPEERRSEIIDLLARGVLRALRQPPEKALEPSPKSSADPNQRVEIETP